MKWEGVSVRGVVFGEMGGCQCEGVVFGEMEGCQCEGCSVW